MKSRPGLLLVSTLVCLCLCGSKPFNEKTIEPKLTTTSDMSAWEFDGSGLWKISDGRLQLVKAGIPSGPIRRPAALAILKSRPFTTVTLELEVKCLAPVDVERRDVDLVLGYESPTMFYYVHLSAVTDDVHNGIFVVSNSDRRRIDSGKGIPFMKDQSWHRVRTTRDAATGTIEVYFDESTTPILSAVDTTIRTGRVGVGSFDDVAQFRKIKVKGK